MACKHLRFINNWGDQPAVCLDCGIKFNPMGFLLGGNMETRAESVKRYLCEKTDELTSNLSDQDATGVYLKLVDHHLAAIEGIKARAEQEQAKLEEKNKATQAPE